MPGSLVGFIEDLVTPHDRDLRAFCVRNLNQEVVRTRNEAFGAVAKIPSGKRRIKKIFAKQNLRASKVGIINGPATPIWNSRFIGST